MSLKGKLETFNIASLLQWLSIDQKTGVLQVSDGENDVEIFIKDGVIVYATSSQKEFRLGQLLKTEGVLSSEELQECLQIAQEKDHQLGRVLVERGYISIDGLKKFLHHQAKEILCNLFLWERGDFEYKDIPLNVEGKLIIPFNTMEIIIEASRRIDEWSVITKQIPNDKVVFKISEKMRDTDEIKLRKNEWRILSLINGTRTVKDVAKESGYDKFLAYKIIYSLMMSGFIEKIGEVYEKERGLIDYMNIIAIFDDIFQTIYNTLKTEIGAMALTIFNECKAKLSSKQRKLLKDFDLKKDVEGNREALLEAMSIFVDLRKGSTFLLQSFSAYLRGVIDKEAEILGAPITKKTLKEIDQVLSYVKKHQKDSDEKIKIVHEIEKIMVELHRQINEKIKG